MFVLKGFVSHAAFANNATGVVAPFGELSTYSSTYARDKGLYKSAASADMELTTFITANNATPVQLTQDVVDHVIGICKYVFDRVQSVHGEIFDDELLQDLLVRYATSAESFECGDIIKDNNGYWAPTWLSWKNKSIAPLQPDNSIKIWFADQAFQEEYDEFSIVVVPPTANIDDFFKTGSEVEAMLKAITPSQSMEKVQIAKGTTPESIIRAETYNYVDPYNALHKVPATWHVLIYGVAGNNIDSINDAIIDAILSQSSHTRDEWVQILPDLFRRTEFILVPLWNQYAIPNRELQAGIYSPTTNLKRATALIKQVVASYPGSHIDDHLDVFAHPYKSLSIAAIGSKDNRDDLFELTDVFGDYIAVSSTSVDFNRQSLPTQEWSQLLANMLIQAEKVGKYTSVPVGMTKVTRDNVLYVVARYGNINYLVAAKSSLPGHDVM
jgi:hypothetical protein